MLLMNIVIKIKILLILLNLIRVKNLFKLRRDFFLVEIYKNSILIKMRILGC